MPSAKKQKASKKTDPLLINTLTTFYTKHLVLVWFLIIFIPILIIAIGCILLPELFYDDFVWRYFWGTIEADAEEKSYGDVTEAYNAVNTIFYGLVVIVVLYWIYKLFKKFEIVLDVKFFIAIIPFILIGGIARALEDAELFYKPIVYLFIAPIIYIFIGVVVLGLIALGVFIQRSIHKTGLQHGLIFAAGVFIGLDIIYLLVYILFSQQFSYILHPIVPVIISLIFIYGLIYYSKRIERFEVSVFLLLAGLWFLIINLLVLFQWQSIQSWTDAYLTANPGKIVQLQPVAFIQVIGLTVICVVIVYVIAKSLSTRYPKMLPFALGTNLILFFGHFLDASATFVAIDYFGYAEKHVLPTFLIESFNTAAVMLPLKGFIVVLIIYFMDILYKKDFQDNPTLTGLVKVAVLVLGLAPGIRDLLRLAIGV